MQLNDDQLQNVVGGFGGFGDYDPEPGYYAKTIGADWSLGPYATWQEAEQAVQDCIRNNGWGALQYKVYYFD